MLVTFDLKRELYEHLLDALTEQDIAEFNAEFGYSYSRAEFAYVAPTVSLIDELLGKYYGRSIPFKTGPFKVRWQGPIVQVEVEITYRPYLVPN